MYNWALLEPAEAGNSDFFTAVYHGYGFVLYGELTYVSVYYCYGCVQYSMG